MKLSEKSIAVFDSGIGGLSVLRELEKHLPAENFVYLADNEFCPYGERSDEEIKRRCLRIFEYFRAMDVKAIVFACNTATAAAIQEVRALSDATALENKKVLIFGIEPAIKPAALSTNNNHIAVLATQSTLKSQQFIELISEFAPEKEIISIEAPSLVNIVESGEWNSSNTQRELRFLLRDCLNEIDTLILGCTHFAFLKDALKQTIKQQINIIDTALPVALWVGKKLKSEKMENQTGNTTQNLTIQFTKQSDLSDDLVQKLFPNSRIEHVILPEKL